MLTPLMLTAVLFSCTKKEISQEQSLETQLPESQVASAGLANFPNIVYLENFEGPSAFASYVNDQTATSYGIARVTSPVFQGSAAGRFEIRDTDPEASGGTRSEVLFPEQTSLNRWYAFAVYFPSDQYKYDETDETICQWHQEGGTSASISLRTKNDRLVLSVIPSYKGTSQKYDVGAVTKDAWNTVILHVNHSPDSDGLIELWVNGQKVAERTGDNMYSLSNSGVVTPRWKLGVYKSKWNGSNTTATSERVLYVDNVILGNEHATYEEIASVLASGSDTTGSTD